jgi:hypothetical protein
MGVGAVSHGPRVEGRTGFQPENDKAPRHIKPGGLRSDIASFGLSLRRRGDMAFASLADAAHQPVAGRSYRPAPGPHRTHRGSTSHN